VLGRGDNRRCKVVLRGDVVDRVVDEDRVELLAEPDVATAAATLTTRFSAMPA